MTTKLKPILLFLGVIAAVGIWLAADWKTTYTPVKAQVGSGFGRPPCISAGGICTMQQITNSENLPPDLDAAGELYLSETGKLIFEISKETISVSDAQMQFQNGQFMMTENFEIPTEISQAIESPQSSLVINSGNEELRLKTIRLLQIISILSVISLGILLSFCS